MIEIRRAVHEDKPRIVEISSKIWDGEDYLPHIFNKWVDEKGGEFSVITVDGVVAGCAKITELPHNVLWLEGIRVDTDYRGRGLGKSLAEYQLKRAKEIGYEKLELGTFVENYESIAIIEKRGFERVASFKFLLNPFDDASVNPNDESITEVTINPADVIQVKHISEVPNLLTMLDTENRQSYTNLDWTFLKCDENHLKELIRRGCVYQYKDTVFAFGNWNQKDEGMTIYFMFGEEKREVVTYVLNRAKELKVSNVIIMSSEGESEHELLYKNGFIAIAKEVQDVFVYRYKSNG